LHETKDASKMEALMAPFAPYRTLATWYMWRALESTPFDDSLM
jgi:3-methyladenine DNA glycosylase/8-oxoguanine DNA glycosylase